jgi:hypothetical protein
MIESIPVNIEILAVNDLISTTQQALIEKMVLRLLVSPDFLASDFIHQNELPRLLKAAEKEGLTALWVPISDSSYTEQSPDRKRSQHFHVRVRGSELRCAFSRG